MSDLSKTWELVELEKVASKVVDGSHNPPKKQPTGFPMLSGRNIEDGKITYAPLLYITSDAFEIEHKRTRIAEGDVLLTIVGTIGRSAVVSKLNEPFTLQRSVAAITPSGIDSRFLMHQFHSPRIQNFLRANAKGSAQQGVYLKTLRSIQTLLPPLTEQRRIVAKIEELFSKLDAGVDALKKAKAQLKRYRQSVLAAAVTGELTKEWREANPNTEPASKLLKRVLKQRREQWNGRGKYKEPTTPETKGLPSLPSNWTWATVAQQAAPDERAITDGPFGSKLKSRHYTDSGPRVLRLQNIGDGIFKNEYAHVSNEHFETLTNHQIFVGDQLIRALGIPPHQTCMVPEGIGLSIVKADCIRFKVFEQHIDPKFTLLALNSYLVRIRAEKHIHGVGRPRLNGTEIKSIALPFPPLTEQHQIATEDEARTTVIDHVESELDQQLLCATKLQQSTLSSAFCGKF